MAGTWSERFIAYFDRDAAQRAAKSLANGAEIEFSIRESGSSSATEQFTFTRESGRNRVVAGPARDPQLLFTIPPQSAEEILSHPSESIGEIGVHIAKLLVSPDANRRVHIQLKAGFLTLFAQGYFGVIAAGGTEFASHLASMGLGGMGAIKSAIKKIKG